MVQVNCREVPIYGLSAAFATFSDFIGNIEPSRVSCHD